MRALLLCAGIGTRLRPLTDAIPKCLAPIKGRPLLEYWLRALPRTSIERILVNTHHHREMVVKVLHGGRDADRIDIVHEDHLLGTGGTIWRNRVFFQREPFLVAHGDNLTGFIADDLLRAHRQRPVGTLATMMTFETDDPRSCGIVEKDARGVLRAFYEKVSDPPGIEANAAVYVFEPEILDRLQALQKETIDISTELIPGLYGKIYCYHSPRYHRDIGTLASWRQANVDFPGSAPEQPPFDPWHQLLEEKNGRLRAQIEALLP